ncbi:PucR family transcriptional regulator [Peribacillus frigoritolerans]|jgi:sugar diacid utilization regulator|uniref:PucR family transcriptional regulator n=1 Tax=Peribacillus frigoritolerans TaxID=450367 RepID=UPI002E22475F|nr:PucR family transcriptional regulator [Peribacillus frigoritolerans]
MYLTIEKALKLPALNQVEVIGGSQGLTRVINSVSIMDHPDISWIKRGELLLTTGYVFKDDLNAQINLVRELSKRGSAGLAIKIKRFLSTIPPGMVEEANKYNFPLLEIPYEMPLSDLLFSFTYELVNKEKVKHNGKGSVEVFHSLLNGENRSSSFIPLLQEFGFNPDRPYILLLINGTKEEGDSFFPIGRMLEKLSQTEREDFKYWNIDFDGQLIILQGKGVVTDEHLLMQAQRIAILLEGLISKDNPGTSLSMGLSKVKKEIYNMKEGFIEAKKAIQLGSRLNPTNINDYASVEVEDLINQIPKDAITQYVLSMIQPIIVYDRENEGELLKTLETYLFSRGRIEDAARALFVHRNTVKFRLSRIEDLLGVDLKSRDIAFKLQFSIKAAKLLLHD